MICQRSGHCCVEMFVVIRDGGQLRLKPAGVPCPHLSFDGPTAFCAVHDEPWYKKSPCYFYGNPDIDPDHAGMPKKPCMVGKYIQKQGGLVALRGLPQTVQMEELSLPENIDPLMVGEILADMDK